jgi:S-DNA-T family DNA segregation ATPase FtsK/SpoIIIE
MFFNKKIPETGRRSGAARAARKPDLATRSPRFARLVRESWWLIVVAGFVWLALVLASYSKSDPGWSFTGTGAPIANRGGTAGAWLADMLLYLFGGSAWWFVAGGIALVVAGYRRIGHPDYESDHPISLGFLGFGLVLLTSAALEALRLYRLPMQLPLRPGGAIGEMLGAALARFAGFNGATLLLIVLLAIGWSLFSGMSWLRLMERVGAGLERIVAIMRERSEAKRERELGAQATAVREAVVQAKHDPAPREPVLVVAPVAEVQKSERVVREKQRPLFVDMPDSPLPPLALLDDAPPKASSPTSASPCTCWRRIRGR